MLKSFLQRYLPTRKELHRYSSLRFALGERLHDPNVWHLNRRSVSGAVSLGVFVAWVPLPIQMILAAAVALALRINLPVSVVTVWVSNPVTIGPMYWLAWRLGAYLLAIPPSHVHFQPTVAWLLGALDRIWQPLALGCLILGVVSALASYAVVRLLWRLHIVRTLLQRRRRSHRIRLKKKPYFSDNN